VGEALRLALVVLGDEKQLPPRKKAWPFCRSTFLSCCTGRC